MAPDNGAVIKYCTAMREICAACGPKGSKSSKTEKAQTMIKYCLAGALAPRRRTADALGSVGQGVRTTPRASIKVWRRLCPRTCQTTKN